MLISHKHKFITVDIPKTGTRSLRETLTPLGIIDFFGYPGYKGELFKQHSTAKDIKHYFMELYNNVCVWDDYKKFTIVRDPWKRYVSFFLFNKKHGLEYRDTPSSDKKTWPISRIEQGKACLLFLNSVSMDETVGLKKTIRMQKPQSDFFIDGDEVLVDFFADTATLRADIISFLKTVGVNHVNDITHANKSTYKKQYSDYYDQEAIDMVAEKERLLIERFGYEYNT